MDRRDKLFETRLFVLCTFVMVLSLGIMFFKNEKKLESFKETYYKDKLSNDQRIYEIINILDEGKDIDLQSLRNKVEEIKKGE